MTAQFARTRGIRRTAEPTRSGKLDRVANLGSLPRLVAQTLTGRHIRHGERDHGALVRACIRPHSRPATTLRRLFLT